VNVITIITAVCVRAVEWLQASTRHKARVIITKRKPKGKKRALVINKKEAYNEPRWGVTLIIRFYRVFSVDVDGRGGRTCYDEI
jgi:hypothetical protein